MQLDAPDYAKIEEEAGLATRQAIEIIWRLLMELQRDLRYIRTQL